MWSTMTRLSWHAPRSVMPRRRAWSVAGYLFGFAFLTTDPASALVQIREERWILETHGSTRILVHFVADISPSDLDPQQGIRFTIAEHGSENDSLLSYVLGFDALPPPGTSVLATVVFTLTCDSQNRVEVEPQHCFITWCDPVLGQQTRGGSGLGSGQIGSFGTMEEYEFVVLDENGNEGTRPTDEDFFACGGTSVEPAINSISKHPFDAFEDMPGTEAIFPSGLTAARAHLAYDEPTAIPAGKLSISFEPLAHQCSGPTPINQAVWLYVVMKLDGATACGIGGAEFRIEGWPEEWPAIITPANPDGYGFGNPLVEGGVVAFPCDRGTEGYVTISKILAFPTTSVSDVVLEIQSHSTPLNPYFLCALAVICDRPLYSLHCVETGRAVLNRQTVACDVPTETEASTWSRVKGFYRD